MYTNPSAAQTLQYIREALETSIAPELQSDGAKVLLAMILTKIKSVEKRIPVEQQLMADECNRMQSFMQEAVKRLDGDRSEAAEQVRSLARQFPDGPQFAPQPSFVELSDTYGRMSALFTESLGALHQLAADAHPEGQALLDAARAYIALRLDRDLTYVFAMEGGMVGRG